MKYNCAYDVCTQVLDLLFDDDGSKRNAVRGKMTPNPKLTLT